MNIASLIMVIQCLAIAILFFELIFAILQKPSDLQKHVIALCTCTMIMFIGYIIELSSVNLEEALAGTVFSYVGKPFVMLFSFMFISTFYGKKIPNIVFIVLAVYCSLFSIIVFTNNYHHLYYASVSFDIMQKYSPLIITRGTLYYSYVVTALLYFFGCIFITINGYRKTKDPKKKKLSFWILLMIISGISGYIVYLTDVTNGYDSTMLGVFGSVICLFILFTRLNIFDATTLAKDQALADSTSGLIVLNEEDQVVYKNEIIKKFEEEGINKYIDFNQTEEDKICKLNNNVYSIKVKKIYDHEQYVGKAIEISDITIVHNYQKNLEKAVKERTEKLENVQRDIIASVANLVEARSSETGTHIKKVSKLTKNICDELINMGLYPDILTPEYVNIMVSAAPLHDVGKIAVPDSILNKPGRLSPEEFDIMKKHVDSGSEIIENTLRGLESDEYVEVAKDIAQYHHERWDGTGYTKSLKGNDIPLCARIVAIADCYDALTSKRCYKPSYSHVDAIQIIKHETGTHFDPTVIHAFLVSMHEE